MEPPLVFETASLQLGAAFVSERPPANSQPLAFHHTSVAHARLCAIEPTQANDGAWICTVRIPQEAISLPTTHGFKPDIDNMGSGNAVSGM